MKDMNINNLHRNFSAFYFAPLLLTVALTLVLTLTFTLNGVVAHAQEYGDPSARVARLNFVQGEVSFQPGGESDWVWARINRPLTNGDSLWTGQDARAELHVGSTAIRIAGQTAMTILNVDNNTIQMQLNSGTMTLHASNIYDNNVIEVDTPNLAFTATQRGNYRISVDPDGFTTVVSVRAGEGQINGGGQAFLLDSGSQAQVSGTDSISYDVYDLPQQDSFDQWSSFRDQREERSQAVRYVSPEMTGYEDLDRDGTWHNDRTYGNVWSPNNVPSNWAPYHDGHWAWVSPWGWTWVDDQPFGFVTSHYGRWAYLNNGYYGQGGWSWIPPQRDPNDQARFRRPVYAPALVLFAGDANSLNGGGGGGDVAWFPLAPGEVYVPAYKTSPTYITQVNITNTTVQQTVITNIVNNPTRQVTYINQNVAGAVTAVPKAAFVSAQPVAKSAVKISAAVIAAAPIVRAAPVAPVKTSVTGGTGSSASSKTAARPPAPPTAVVTRAVVAKVAPPPPPVPFVQKQQALAANPGKPLDPKMEQSLRAAAPPPVRVVKAAPPAAVVKAAVAAPKPQSSAPPAGSRPSAITSKPTATTPPAPPSKTPAVTQQQQQQQIAQAEEAKAKQQQLAQQEAEKAHQQQLQQQQAQRGTQPSNHAANSAANNSGNKAGNNPSNTAGGAPVRIPEEVQAGKLLSQPKVPNPMDAKGQPIHGVVRLQLLIGSDGKVKSATVLSGPPALHEAATQDARQREYRPTIDNGVPVEVETEMAITF